MKTINIKQILARVQGLNPSLSTVSSVGTFVSSQSQQIADALRAELIAAVPADSLAFKILHDIEKFSDKQLWVIAFELQKNAQFCETLSSEIEDLQNAIDRKKAAKSAKMTAKTVAKKATAEIIAKTNEQLNYIEIGSKVEHKSFGIGTVTSYDENVIIIDFDDFGEKKLVKNYAPLTILA